MTRLHAGGKFGGGSYAATGGLHGVGACVVNALSARLDVEVDRDGVTYVMSFRRGKPGVFAGDGAAAPFTERSGLDKVGKTAKKVTGTRVRFWADRQIFLAEAAIDLDELHDRARQTAFLVPGLTIVVRDERAARARPRRSSATTAGSSTSSTSSPPTSRSATRCGCRGRVSSPRPCRCSTRPGT